jgi:TRAP-type mannitol/chloroaromatic compound transport system substrate-binding protein
MEAAFKASNEAVAEISAQNAEFKMFADSVTAFRNEFYLYNQLMDYSYDTFMLRMRARG